MKKFIKNNIKVIVAVIITAIISITGTTYATGILASQVTYDNTTVDQALNVLYGKANKIYTTTDVIYSTNQGNGESSKTTTISLDKGKYLIFSTTGLGWPASSTTSTNREMTADNISCSNCTFNRIFGWLNEPHCSTTYTSSYNYYSAVSVGTRIYYAEISEDNTTITVESTTSNTSPNKIAQTVTIAAIKLD